MSSQALLPCPFCSHSDITIKNQNPEDNSGGYYIECPGCGASTSLRYACGDDPTPLLSEQWNRRSPAQCLHQIAEPAAAPEWKDHQTAQLVGQLTEVAREFHGAQQLRERIAGLIHPLAEKAQAAQAAVPVAWAAVYFGGKRNGEIYSTCGTEKECNDYIALVHQQSDSVTLTAKPICFANTATAHPVEGVPAHWADSLDDKPASRADLERVLDAWNETTGALPRDSGWRGEVLGMLEDAHDLGAHQAAATPAAPETVVDCGAGITKKSDETQQPCGLRGGGEVVLPEPVENADGYLPCPFCGSDQVSKSEGSTATGAPWFYVECESCEATAEPEKWNERALLAQASAPAADAPRQAVLDSRWRERMLDGRALVRDEMGFGEHPELPMLDEGMKPREFFAALGIVLQHTMAEDDLDPDEHEAMNDAGNWNAWTPQPPAGEGWKLVAIFDTEDGQAAWWMNDAQRAAAQKGE